MRPQSQALSLQASRRIARILAFAMWFSVLIYGFAFAQAKLRGDFAAFAGSLRTVPWADPRIPMFGALAAVDLVMAMVLRRIQLAKASAEPAGPARWVIERKAMIISIAVLEAIALVGIALGFSTATEEAKAIAPLVGLFILVPLVVIPFMLPPHARLGQEGPEAEAFPGGRA